MGMVWNAMKCGFGGRIGWELGGVVRKGLRWLMLLGLSYFAFTHYDDYSNAVARGRTREANEIRAQKGLPLLAMPGEAKQKDEQKKASDHKLSTKAVDNSPHKPAQTPAAVRPMTTAEMWGIPEPAQRQQEQPAARQ